MRSCDVPLVPAVVFQPPKPSWHSFPCPEPLEDGGPGEPGMVKAQLAVIFGERFARS